jgi:hypothetical protein
VDLEMCPEEFHHEYIYSRLLEILKPLIINIVTDKTKWRIQEVFIKNFGSVVGCFNAIEIQELLLTKI